jgi:hypothetical protein
VFRSFSFVSMLAALCAALASAQIDHRLRPGEQVGFVGHPRIDLTLGGSVELWLRPEWGAQSFLFKDDPNGFDGTAGKATAIVAPTNVGMYSPLLTLGDPDQVGFVLWADPRFQASPSDGSWLGIASSYLRDRRTSRRTVRRRSRCHVPNRGCRRSSHRRSPRCGNRWLRARGDGSDPE